MSKVIAIDNGHGANTSGKRTPKWTDGTRSPDTNKNFMHEWEFNIAVARELNKELKRNGFKTVMVSDTSTDTPLSTRVSRANNAKADLFVSIHANANTGNWGSWGGTETYTYFKGESHRVGKIVHKNLMKATKLRDRGVKNGDWLYVIRNTKMPAILLECAFMDNLAESKKLISSSFRKSVAKHIAMGICEAYGVKYKDGATTSPSNPSRPLLVKGNKGEDVKRAQRLLNSKSKKSPKLVVDGDFGGLTYDATVAFQKERKIKADGKVGNQTWAELEKPKPTSSTPAKPKELYRVRKSWKDERSQIGAYSDLSNAKKIANGNRGYNVYDSKGKLVHRGQIIHTVKKDQTLWGIAQDYKTTVEKIKKDNGLKSDIIRVGQKLKI